MFLRQKRNKSGSTSLHIVAKRGRDQITVATVGTAYNEQELKVLQLKGREQLASLQQQGVLNFAFEDDKTFIDQLVSSIERIEISGTELILGKLFNEIGFNRVKEPLFRHLVLSRICYPGSKLKTTEYLLRHYQIFYEIDAVYRYLDKIIFTYKDLLQDISYHHTEGVLKEGVSVVFYDVTTLYFESSEEDELRRIGFSKDGKHQHPQIILGLLVSAQGYPLAFEMFEGNKFEGQTMLPVVEKFKARYGLQDLVVVADSGLLSDRNIQDLKKLHYRFILGARIRKESPGLRRKILDQEWENGQSRVFPKAENIKLIVSYSDARAHNDRKNRDRGIQRLEKAFKTGRLTKKYINNRGYNKYLQLNGKVAVQIDYQKIKLDSQWDGLKGYLTNARMRPDQIINHYGQLWLIEKAFRMSKTDLRVRPIYHRISRRIEAHLIVAFCSYKLYKELERQLKQKKMDLSPEKAVEIMKSIFTIKAKLPESGKTIEVIMAKSQEQQTLLSAFGIKYPN